MHLLLISQLIDKIKKHIAQLFCTREFCQRFMWQEELKRQNWQHGVTSLMNLLLKRFAIFISINDGGKQIIMEKQ